MKVVNPADASEASLVRDIDAIDAGYPTVGVNGPGNNPPPIDPPGQGWRGWTRYRKDPFEYAGLIAFELTPSLETRVTVSTPDFRDWLISKGYPVTTAQAARVRALIATAHEIADPVAAKKAS